MSNITTNLIGAKVKIDPEYPSRCQDGVIVAFSPESTEEFLIQHSDGKLSAVPIGRVTITEPAPDPMEKILEIVSGIQQNVYEGFYGIRLAIDNQG